MTLSTSVGAGNSYASDSDPVPIPGLGSKFELQKLPAPALVDSK